MNKTTNGATYDYDPGTGLAMVNRDDCGHAWAVNSGGRLPRRWWACPHGCAA